MQINKNAEKLIRQLNNQGYEAFIVGGCVRDYLLGLTPHDTDICTNALPEQTKKCFEAYRTFDTGIKHGTISVVCGGEVYEITTYRIAGDYSDNRHPDSVSFTRNINEDLRRRDFTVNAMAYNAEYGLVDPYGGKNDLKDKIIRCVGNPDTRFNEDALRILRALRFASVYGFSIEENTSKSIFKNADLLKNIATERVISEFLKLICGKDAVKILDAYRETIAVIIPEITVMFNFNQNNIHHSYDLWQHTLTALGAIEPNPILRMTMLLHDIGKALDHEIEGSHVQIGVDICRKYKENTQFIHAIEAHHGDVEPKTPLAFIIQACDAISAARPGARRENVESYVKRLENLEEISSSFEGVEQAFAVQAGREVRIMVKPDVISDDQVILLARSIAKKIEDTLDYPGQIKVNVIRESRAVEYAK